MQTKHTIRIVLSSPSNVDDECRVMDGVIAELNRGVAHERHVALELTHWKTDAYPGFHPEGPQGLIDPILKIQDCDILLAIFWKRFGTPAKGALSGAEHEIRTAIKARQDASRPQIMIYFKEAAAELKTPEELRQYAAVLEFKQEVSPLGLLETGNRIAAELEKLARKYPRAKIIAAARPIAVRQGDFAKFRRLDVLPLTPEMIQAYVEKWFAGEPEKIAALQQSLAQRPRIRDLAANPFLLSMICFTFEQGGDAALLERRSDLYAKCTQYLLERAYDPESSASAKSHYENTIEILKDVSLRFFLWKEDDFPVDHVNVMGQRALSAETLGRPEDFLNRLEAETGLIQRAKEGFTFVHRSLWEYFTALALCDKTNDFVIRHAANPDWEEVVRLYAGLLQNNDKVVELVNGLWNLNRPLALRVTTEVKTPAAELLKPLIAKEEGKQSKLLLIDNLEQSLRLIAVTDQQKLVEETLDILLLKCAERDCEVIYHAQELLEKLGMQPLQPGGLIYELFDLAHAAERQQKFLADPANHFEWIEVEGGEFWMGDDEHFDNEKPAYRVKVDSFRMAKHQVTNRLLSNFPFGEYPNYGGENHPAIGNTWWEAYYFALWIDSRLPTEAEWEYAARGGKKAKRTQYYFGDAEEELPNHAWFGEGGREHPHAVDEINPRTGKENLNPLGLANILGNVWEKCADWYDESYYKNSPESNPKGPAQGTRRVLRGGSWDDLPSNLRCAFRARNAPSTNHTRIGFRCAQDGR